MKNTRDEQLEEIKAKLDHLYRERAPINDMGARVDLNAQVLPHLNLDKIFDWAAVLTPETVVGHAVQADDCPVHRYLQHCGYTPTLITPCSIRGKGFVFAGLTHEDRIPRNVKRLISLVDTRAAAGTAVTAKTLIELIQQINQTLKSFDTTRFDDKLGV